MRNILAILCLLQFCACKPLTKSIDGNPGLREKQEYPALPANTPVYVLYADEKLPEKSLFVGNGRIAILSSFGPTFMQPQYRDVRYYYNNIKKAKLDALRRGGNILQFFKTNYFSDGHSAEFILYRNIELDSAKFRATRNASLLPNNANYANIYFFNDKEKFEKCNIIGDSNKTLGTLTYIDKFVFKTSNFGKQNFYIDGITESKIVMDVQAGQEYFVSLSRKKNERQPNGIIVLEQLENYIGRHFFNKLILKK
jgi:hypothetical protein